MAINAVAKLFKLGESQIISSLYASKHERNRKKNGQKITVEFCDKVYK